MRRTDFRIPLRVVPCLAILFVLAPMAAAAGSGPGRPGYRSVSRYPVAVAPVVEDLAAVVRRDRAATAKRAPAMTSQRCPEIDEPESFSGSGAPPAARSTASTTPTARKKSPLFLAPPSPAPDRQFDTNPFSN